MSKDKKKAIYASFEKLDRKNSIDEDLTYKDEDDSIEELVKKLKSIDEDLKKDYDDGKELTVYLHQLDSDNIPCYYKSVKVVKDGDDDDDFDVDEIEEIDLPEDFKPWSDDSDESDEDDEEDEKEDKDEDEEEDDKDDDSEDEDESDEADDDEDEEEKEDSEEDGEEEDKDEEKADEEDSSDDVRKVEEAVSLIDPLYALCESELVSPVAIEDAVAALEAVVGKKTYQQAKDDMKKANRDVKKYFKYQAHYGQNVPEEDQEMYNNNSIHDLIKKKDAAKAHYNKIALDYETRRADAKRRLNAYRKDKAIQKLNSMKDSVMDKVSSLGQQKPAMAAVHETAALLEKMCERNFIGEDLCIEMESALYAADIMVQSGLCDILTEFMLMESVGYVEEVSDMILNAYTESNELSDWQKEGLLLVESYMFEKTLKAKDRNKLDDSEFGIPSLRKYPIHDKAHVSAAIQRFNHVDVKHEKELAHNIIKAMKKFGMMNEVEVSDKNRFKKYLKDSEKAFKESFDLYPFPAELTKEFSVGAMLPMMGSTDGWGTKLANTPIEDVVSAGNKDLAKYATLYDTTELYNDAVSERKKLYSGTSFDEKMTDGLVTFESALPRRNPEFDEEAKKLVKALKEYIDNPKNTFMEDIMKKALNFKKTIYTIHLRNQTGTDSNPIIKKIESCGYKEVSDEGVKATYEKSCKNIVVNVFYDAVSDKLRITYDEKNLDVPSYHKESSDEVMNEAAPAALGFAASDLAAFGIFGAVWVSVVAWIGYSWIKSKKIIHDIDKFSTELYNDYIPFKELNITKEPGYIDIQTGEFKSKNPNKAVPIKKISPSVDIVSYSNKLYRASYKNKQFFEYYVSIDSSGNTETYKMYFKAIHPIAKKYELQYLGKIAHKTHVVSSNMERNLEALHKELDAKLDAKKKQEAIKKESVEDVMLEKFSLFKKKANPVICTDEKLVDKARSAIKSTMMDSKYKTYKSAIKVSTKSENRNEAMMTADDNMLAVAAWYELYKLPSHDKVNPSDWNRFLVDFLSDVNEKLKKDHLLVSADGDWDEGDISCYTTSGSMKESVDFMEGAHGTDIDSDIADVIKKLNTLGYRTKYSCSGHVNARFKKDIYRDGVLNDHLYTTARIIFADDYKLKPPAGWVLKDFDEGFGIYPEPKRFKFTDGNPMMAFDTWKDEYMKNLKEWVDTLDEKPGPKEEVKKESFLDSYLGDINAFMEDAYTTEKKRGKNTPNEPLRRNITTTTKIRPLQ